MMKSSKEKGLVDMISISLVWYLVFLVSCAWFFESIGAFDFVRNSILTRFLVAELQNIYDTKDWGMYVATGAMLLILYFLFLVATVFHFCDNSDWNGNGSGEGPDKNGNGWKVCPY